MIIFFSLKRNHIFELEKRIKDAQGSQKDLLELYQNINLEIDKLIKLNQDNQNIIDTLNSKIKNLESDRINLEKRIREKRKRLEKQSVGEINIQNKLVRKLQTLSSKNKGQKKSL